MKPQITFGSDVMSLEKELRLVHFQLTRNCNLRCWFCGQWGRKGFFSDASGESMKYSDWEKVIEDLKNYRKTSGVKPRIILWGGEPLMYSEFDKITNYLYENDFELGIVTNGVLIDKHIDTIKKCIKKIYVSIDGPKDIHNSIRGDGVFEKVYENLKLLKASDTEICVMTVVSEALIPQIENFPAKLSELNLKELFLQEMIFLTKEEAEEYSVWLKNCFNKETAEIYSWMNGTTETFLKREKNIIKKALNKEYPFVVRYMPHGVYDKKDYCRSAFNHVHIAWNGNVLYCTDFYDFSAGNVKKENIIDIFQNEISEKFRNEIISGNCATCNHCSWRGNKNFDL